MHAHMELRRGSIKATVLRRLPLFLLHPAGVTESTLWGFGFLLPSWMSELNISEVK